MRSIQTFKLSRGSHRFNGCDNRFSATGYGIQLRYVIVRVEKGCLIAEEAKIVQDILLITRNRIDSRSIPNSMNPKEIFTILKKTASDCMED